MKNLTFGELMNLVPTTKNEKLPTIKQMKERDPEEILMQEMGVVLFKDGFFLYTRDGRSTVSGVDRCMGIPCEVTEGEGKNAYNRTMTVPEEECKQMEWYWPLMIMGDRRLDHNQEERENSKIEFHADGDGDDWDSALVVPDFTELMMGEQEELELHTKLIAALEALPERQREAVNLYFYKNMKQEDVAKEMGISQPGVVKTLKKAYANLKKQF